ncbi:unnamed protein product [Meloidogyne enterolobii]|uniref:Uncharacterized protein n=1 Tax=Meloidogyne enterolobii TaxID=390850 RepID=A0ACB1AKA8_MELEN
MLTNQRSTTFLVIMRNSLLVTSVDHSGPSDRSLGVPLISQELSKIALLVIMRNSLLVTSVDHSGPIRNYQRSPFWSS